MSHIVYKWFTEIELFALFFPFVNEKCTIQFELSKNSYSDELQSVEVFFQSICYVAS